MGTRRQKKKNLRKWIILVNNIHRGQTWNFFWHKGKKKKIQYIHYVSREIDLTFCLWRGEPTFCLIDIIRWGPLFKKALQTNNDETIMFFFILPNYLHVLRHINFTNNYTKVKLAQAYKKFEVQGDSWPFEK